MNSDEIRLVVRGPDNSTGETIVTKGEKLLDAIQRTGVAIDAVCGGKGTCGRCVVKVTKGSCSSVFSGRMFTRDELEAGVKSCSCRVESGKDGVIEAQVIGGYGNLQIMAASHVNLSKEISVEDLPIAIQSELDSRGEAVGVAYDMGTTTCVLSCLRIKKSMKNSLLIESVDKHLKVNEQARFGADVLSRILHAEEGGLGSLTAELRGPLGNFMNHLENKSGIKNVNIVTLAGNTAMTYFILGMDPKVIRSDPELRNPKLDMTGLKPSDYGAVDMFMMPCIGGFVGGDIVGDILASGMNKSSDVSLLIDVGTNGEVVLGNNEWLMAASCSAGPAFEGGEVGCGLRGETGAISVVNDIFENYKTDYEVIGGEGVRPRGVCGSGFIDLLYEMYNKRIIDGAGNIIATPDNERIFKRDGTIWFNIIREDKKDGQEEIAISEREIKGIIRTKAAIYAGIYTLIKSTGQNPADIKHFYIAGGFGSFINIQKALGLGLFPAIDSAKYEYIGNGSLGGAQLCLFSQRFQKQAQDVVDMTTYLDLNTTPEFMDEYTAAMFIPHTDAKRFER